MTAARRRGGCGRSLGLLVGLAVLLALAAGAVRLLRSRAEAPVAGPTGERPGATPSPTPSPTPRPTPRPRTVAVPADFEPAAGEGRGDVAVVIDDVGNADGSIPASANVRAFQLS